MKWRCQMQVLTRLVGLCVIVVLAVGGCAATTPRADPYPINTPTAVSPRLPTPTRPSPTRGPSPEQRQAVSAVQNYPIGASLGYKNLAECMAFILAVDSVTNNWQFESIGWYSEPSTATVWSVRYNFTKDGKATSASWNYDQRSGNVSGANEYGQLILSTCR